MNEIRCGACSRKLGVGEYRLLIIKCPRCGVVNSLKAESLINPERHRASIRKETHDDNQKHNDL